MADQEDLIDNNNHIIQSIQEHETRIARQEQMTKQMKKHLEGMERELVITKNADNLIIHMIALKSYATTITRHLQRFQEKKFAKDFDKAAEDLRLATRHLGMIVGKVDVEELLGSIFNDFCIGK